MKGTDDEVDRASSKGVRGYTSLQELCGSLSKARSLGFA